MISAAKPIASVKEALSNNGMHNGGSESSKSKSIHPDLYASLCWHFFFRLTAHGCDLILGNQLGW